MQNEKMYRRTAKATALVLVAMFGFLNLEPLITNADNGEFEVGSTNTTVTVTQNVTSEISISKSGDVTMAPTISGMSGGTANGSTTLTVITNDISGFSLSLKSSTSPAMQSPGGTYSFANFTEASAGTPDYSWSVAAADSEFGYTVEPHTASDAVAAFLDNGTDTCGTGTDQTTDKCWAPFSTTDFTVINRPNTTAQAGEAEVVKFRAQSGASHFQNEQTYTAVITATAVTN